jgi:hypothetical protein
VSDEHELVHLGDTEIVDGVIVREGRDVSPWTQAAVYTGAAVVAVGTVIVGTAVVIARRRARLDGPLALLDEVRPLRR